jgi:hydroxymethylpyrimidine pyrophosphatase-like HAD family hydrolase
MAVYLFLDLDDTIFQTRRKCQDSPSLLAVAHGRDGAPLSFMTEKQQTFFRWLGEEAHLIPTTARSYAAFRRVALSFSGMAILDFGGVILDEAGQLDQQWDSTIRPQIATLRDPLRHIHGAILESAAQQNLHIRSRIITDFEMDLYVVTKLLDVEGDDLTRLYELTVRHYANDQFYVHFNDNNLAVIPRCLNKRQAVQYLIDTRLRPSAPQDLITIGMGDSLSDLDFMTLCDYCLTPRSSQIARQLLEAHHV